MVNGYEKVLRTFRTLAPSQLHLLMFVREEGPGKLSHLPTFSTSELPVFKMKVLHLIDSAGLYGAEVMLLHLVAEQIKQGLQPIIASIGEKGIDEKPLETEAKKRGFRVEKFRMTPGPNYLGALKILRFAWHEGVDILHSHGYKGNILFGFIPRKIRRIPIITTVHGYTSIGNGFSRMRAYEWLDSKVLSFMDAVVFVSSAMKSDPRFKHLNPSKVHVIHNGIPLSPQPAQIGQATQSTLLTRVSQGTQQTQRTQATSDLDPEIVSFCTNTSTLGSIGRLSPEKGYIYLVRALKIIRDKGHDVRLVIIGEGGERPRLEGEISTLGLNDYVLLPGYRANASAYLPHFDIFVLPSLTEGLPMTILEAMRARVPIVATKVGGIPEILQGEKSCLFVERRDSRTLADALGRLLEDKRLGKLLADNAYDVLSSEISINKTSIRYRIIYQRINSEAR